LSEVLGGGGNAVEPGPESLKELHEVGAIGRLEGGQNLVELDRGRGGGHGGLAAAVELGRARAAGANVEEEVALEEDPGPDLPLGVLVNGTPGVVHGEGDLRAVADALDPGHLADVDPRDPDGRVLADVGRVRERRLQLVRMLEGELLRPGEV